MSEKQLRTTFGRPTPELPGCREKDFGQGKRPHRSGNVQLARLRGREENERSGAHFLHHGYGFQMTGTYQVVGEDICGFTNRILSESLFATRRCEDTVS